MKKTHSFRPSTKHRSFLFCTLLSVVALLAKYPYTGAEDVVNARNNLISGSRTDFWGSFSPWFFSIVKSTHWEFFYAALFTLMVIFGANRFMVNNFKLLRRPLLFAFFLFLVYSSLIFTISFSRDGVLLAFFWLSLGFWLTAHDKSGLLRNLLLVSSISALSIGLSFRPWLSFSFIFLVLAFNSIYQLFTPKKSKFLLLGVLVFIAVTPVSLDLASHRILNMVASYPQQQVMIMDISSMACLTPTRSQVDQALVALNSIASEHPLTKSVLCEQYYPQNWGSVVFYGARAGQTGALHFIEASNEKTYEKLQENWLGLIASNLPSYIQMKIMIGSQFLLAGESPNLSIRNLQSFLELPVNLAKSMRLYSVIPVFLLLIFSLSRTVRFSKVVEPPTYYGILFYLSFLMTSVIAFIGDNQRYIFVGAIVASLLVVQQTLKWDNEQSQ